MPLAGKAKTDYQRHYMRGKSLARAEAAAKAAPCPDWPDDPARALAEWSAATLKVPPGHPLAGEPMALPEFGRLFFEGALRPEVSEALLCVGRKNAKSAIVAVYLLARLAGPLRTAGYRAGTHHDKTRQVL